jgi:hypothetical protein
MSESDRIFLRTSQHDNWDTKNTTTEHARSKVIWPALHRHIDTALLPDDAQPIHAAERRAGHDDLDVDCAPVGGLFVELVHGGSGARGGLEHDADHDASIRGRGEDGLGAHNGSAPLEDGADVVGCRAAHEAAHLDDVAVGRAGAFYHERFTRWRGGGGECWGGRSARGLAQGVDDERRGDVGTRWACVWGGRELF